MAGWLQGPGAQRWVPPQWRMFQPDPRAVAAFATPRPVAAVPRPNPVEAWRQAVSSLPALAGPNTGLFAPQGQNEPNIGYYARGFGLSEPPLALPDRLRGLPAQAARSVANWATATPSNPAGIFGAGWTATPGQGPGTSRDGGRRKHTGRDWSGMSVGTPLQAPMAGEVIDAGNKGANGNFVTVRWADGTTSTVAHLQQGVQKGMQLQPGQVFGLAGNTGNASTQGTNRAVLHVTQRDPQGNPFDPAGWFGRAEKLAKNFGAAAPAFNPAPFQKAMAAQDQAAQLLMQPTEATFNTTPLPERPQLQEFQTPDTSAGDAAFEQTRPKNPFDDPREQTRVKRQQYFKGIGQALASLSGEEGIGTMLMKIGSGALMGRARGEELIDEREVEFEKQLAEFNRALASREDAKAANAANVLNQNIQLRNARADQIWQDNVKEIEKWQPQVVGGNLVTYARDPKDKNKVTMVSKPLGYGIQAEAIINKASIGMQMGQAATSSAQFGFQHQQATARTALGLTVQSAIQQGNPSAAVEGLEIEAANRVRATVRAGSWRQLLGQDTSGIADGPGGYHETATRRAYQAVGVSVREDGTPVMPLQGNAAREFQQVYEDSLTSMLYEDIAKTNKFSRLFSNPAASSAYNTQRAAGTTERTSVNARGQRSYSSAFSMEE